MKEDTQNITNLKDVIKQLFKSEELLDDHVMSISVKCFEIKRHTRRVN